MVLLSVFDKAKDLASRLLPTPYLGLMEEATDPHLTTPKLSAVTLLCDNANTRTGSVADIVRAVRRRLGHSDAMVQCLTIGVLEALVKSCNAKLHTEVASQKGIVQELFNIATSKPTSEKEYRAKEAALLLILNFSVWFAGHPIAQLKFLTSVAEAVRKAVGPNAFDGLQPDIETRVSMTVGPETQRLHPHRRPPSKSTLNPREADLPPGAHVVDAIGIVLPTDEEVASMLDACMTLAEYLNDVTVHEDGTVEMDDIIESILSSIRSSNKIISLILGSDLNPSNREMLVDVCNSQNSLIQRLSKRASPQAVPQDHAPQLPSGPSANAPGGTPTKVLSATQSATTVNATGPTAPPATSGEHTPDLAPNSRGAQKSVQPAAQPPNPLDRLDDLFSALPARSGPAVSTATDAARPQTSVDGEHIYSSEEVSEERSRQPAKHVDIDFDALFGAKGQR